MISRQRRIDASDLPDSEQRFAQAALADRMLGDAGYQAIGFDHFALPHDPLAVDAVVSFEHSADLSSASWQPVVPAATQILPDGGWRVSFPVETVRGFIRVKVLLP